MCDFYRECSVSRWTGLWSHREAGGEERLADVSSVGSTGPAPGPLSADGGQAHGGTRVCVHCSRRNPTWLPTSLQGLHYLLL